MTDLLSWMVELLFPYFSAATTGIAVLLSILYVLSVVRSWIVERFK